MAVKKIMLDIQKIIYYDYEQGRLKMKKKRGLKYTIEFYKCVKCRYEWVSRVRKPKECPNCKNRKWSGERR